MEAVSLIGQSAPIARANPRTVEIEQGLAKQESQAHDVEGTPENTEKIHSAVQALNLFHEDRDHTRFQYRINPDYGTVQVTLMNYLTGEVMQQVPSSKLLEFSHKMREMSGLLLEERA